MKYLNFYNRIQNPLDDEKVLEVSGNLPSDVNVSYSYNVLTYVGSIEVTATFIGDYGDAYAVGPDAPYSFYIWTRADVAAGHPEDYWFDIGPLAIVGPEGPQGPQGEKGETGESPRFFVQSNTPTSSKVGDAWLKPNGDILIRTAGGWYATTVNIRGSQGIMGIQGERGPTGPAGPQGPQGIQGPAGGFINIFGILENTDQLPTPTSLNNLTAAYLIKHTTEGQEDHYHLWIQVGSTPQNATWNDAGPFNLGTLVFANGIPLETFDADTKLDKFPVANETTVTVINSDGTQGYKRVAGGVINMTSGAIPIYLGSSLSTESIPGGQLMTGMPGVPGAAANKKYVDDQIAAHMSGGGGGSGTMYMHYLSMVCSGMTIEVPIISSKPADQITTQDFINRLTAWGPYPYMIRIADPGNTDNNGGPGFIEYYPEGPTGQPNLYVVSFLNIQTGTDTALPTSITVIKTTTL